MKLRLTYWCLFGKLLFVQGLKSKFPQTLRSRAMGTQYYEQITLSNRMECEMIKGNTRRAKRA